MQYFNIQIASQISGVASATIRAWEKRYNAIVPERAENKHRLYSEKDIEKLAILFKLTEFGQSIGKIAHFDLEELKNIFSTLLHRPYDERQVMNTNHNNVDYEKILTSLHLALSAYKLDIISHELEKARNSLTPKDFALNIIVPLFKTIGQKVYEGQISIAQEHAISAITSFNAGQMIGQHYQKNIPRDDLILITTPEGEFHTIGILAASLLCVHYGIRFIFLGPSLPANSLSEMCNALNARSIILGLSKGHELDENRTLDDYLQQLKQHLNPKVDILVGGNLKNYAKIELEKKKIPFFPTLESLSYYLEKY